MARLEDLIDTVHDAQLRDALREEVKALKTRTPFGLVYERHLPETVGLAINGGLRVGDQVRLRQRAGTTELLLVQSARDGRAAVVDESGNETTVPVKDLLTVRRFGDPIFPTLTSLGAIQQSKERPYHAVINGENFHALQLLLHTCEGLVDCIYIDPPYNSGARDWKYNNDYVDSNDRWRHSKWLSMMEKRLRIAKRLLKSDGVLIVTVDENEVYHLGMLLEELFPEYLRYMITIVINPKGTAKVNFGRVEEYAVFLVPDTGEDVIAQLAPPEDQPEASLTVEIEDEDGGEDGPWTREIGPGGDVRLPAALRRQLGLDGVGGELDISLPKDRVVELRIVEDDDEDADVETEDDAGDREEYSVLFLRRRGAESSFRHQRWRQFYGIRLNESTKTVVGIGPELEEDEPYELGRREGDVLWVYPVDEEGNERVWRYGRDTMQALIDAGQIRVGKHSPGKPQPYTLNHYKPREGPRRQRVRTVWWRTSHDAGTHGTTLITRLLGKTNPFPFPKSVYAVRDCLEAVVRDRPNALIVDFFAGSGTTLHSTCLLNADDGGRRRTILVTNNEVEEAVAKRLHKQGLYQGDPEFEALGIFEAATRPRCEAALTGKLPNGTPIPRGKRYQYLDGRPFAQGFDENCEFFRLAYLNPDQVELGKCFDALHPLLWLRAGARSARPKRLRSEGGFAIVAQSGYAVLFDEKAMPELIAALNEHDAVDHVCLCTDSDDAYAEMCELLGRGVSTERLYGDYLDEFRRGVAFGA